MKHTIFLVLLLVILDSVHSQKACVQGNWVACGAEVARSIYSYFNTWGDYEQRDIFGTTCISSIKGGFYRWKWRWQAQFRCPSLSTMEGSSSNWESRNGAIEHAIEDYVRLGRQHGFLTDHQLRNPVKHVEQHTQGQKKDLGIFKGGLLRRIMKQ